MYAVIMAGGKGTRIKSLEPNLPKPMIKICDKPVLEHQIDSLKNSGITDIVLVIGYLGDKIKEYFKDGKEFGVNITYINEDEPLGTAGSLYYLKDRKNTLCCYQGLSIVKYLYYTFYWYWAEISY